MTTSGFSDLDSSPRVEALLAYLDDTDAFMSAFKAYSVAAIQRYAPGGRVLDLGCGVGHDLARLTSLGLSAVGVDTSQAALSHAQARCAAVVRGDAARLPFRTGSFDGCRIERVLQHVMEPDVVVDEIVRVVRPGGVLAVLDADHTSLNVQSEVDPGGTLLGRLAVARHPSMGARLPDMLTAKRCRVDDVVTEHSFGYDLGGLPCDPLLATARAVTAGTITERFRQEWLEEQGKRSSDGRFRATWDKVLVVARTDGYEGSTRGPASRQLTRR